MLENYDDAESPSEDQGETTEGSQEMADSGKTALVDSSLCPGMKPGDTFTVRVDKVLDSGEYVLSYPEEESEEPEPTMEEGMAPESEMASYMG